MEWYLSVVNDKADLLAKYALRIFNLTMWKAPFDAAFSHDVPQKLVNGMTGNSEMIDVKGESRVRMVLVSHVIGLTDISVKLDCRSYRK